MLEHPRLHYIAHQHREGTNHLAPLLILIDFRSHSSFLFTSFEAVSHARSAARRDGVAGCVQNLKGNCFNELVRIDTDLDGSRESVCLYPNPGRAKDEGVGDRGVIVALGVPPDPQAGGG
jgi:hypothetical protein